MDGLRKKMPDSSGKLKHKYSKDELLSISKSSSCFKIPPCFFQKSLTGDIPIKNSGDLNHTKHDNYDAHDTYIRRVIPSTMHDFFTKGNKINSKYGFPKAHESNDKSHYRHDNHSFKPEYLKREDKGIYNQNVRPHYQSTFKDSYEPEWFTEGPSSHLDKIELHGFDDKKETKFKDFKMTHPSVQEYKFREPNVTSVSAIESPKEIIEDFKDIKVTTESKITSGSRFQAFFQRSQSTTVNQDFVTAITPQFSPKTTTPSSTTSSTHSPLFEFINTNNVTPSPVDFITTATVGIGDSLLTPFQKLLMAVKKQEINPETPVSIESVATVQKDEILTEEDLLKNLENPTNNNSNTNDPARNIGYMGNEITGNGNAPLDSSIYEKELIDKIAKQNVIKHFYSGNQNPAAAVAATTYSRNPTAAAPIPTSFNHMAGRQNDFNNMAPNFMGQRPPPNMPPPLLPPPFPPNFVFPPRLPPHLIPSLTAMHQHLQGCYSVNETPLNDNVVDKASSIPNSNPPSAAAISALHHNYNYQVRILAMAAAAAAAASNKSVPTTAGINLTGGPPLNSSSFIELTQSGPPPSGTTFPLYHPQQQQQNRNQAFQQQSLSYEVPNLVKQEITSDPTGYKSPNLIAHFFDERHNSKHREINLSTENQKMTDNSKYLFEKAPAFTPNAVFRNLLSSTSDNQGKTNVKTASTSNNHQAMNSAISAIKHHQHQSNTYEIDKCSSSGNRLFNNANANEITQVAETNMADYNSINNNNYNSGHVHHNNIIGNGIPDEHIKLLQNQYTALINLLQNPDQLSPNHLTVLQNYFQQFQAAIVAADLQKHFVNLCPVDRTDCSKSISTNENKEHREQYLANSSSNLAPFAQIKNDLSGANTDEPLIKF